MQRVCFIWLDSTAARIRKLSAVFIVCLSVQVCSRIVISWRKVTNLCSALTYSVPSCVQSPFVANSLANRMVVQDASAFTICQPNR
jgi:hypothetical protein